MSDYKRCSYCDGTDGNCEECAGTGWLLPTARFTAGGVVGKDAGDRMARYIEANEGCQRFEAIYAQRGVDVRTLRRVRDGVLA
jgi:hypothetical protein